MNLLGEKKKKRAKSALPFLQSVSNSVALKKIPGNYLEHSRSFPEEMLKENRSPQEPRRAALALTKPALSSRAPDFMPTSFYSFRSLHLNPRFQAWESEPSGTCNVKQDPAKHSEFSLASSQNLAEPQSFTWF